MRPENRPETSPETPPERSAARHDPPDLATRLIYRDGLILIVDKPAGWAVHRGPESLPRRQPTDGASQGRPGGARNLEDHFGQLRFGLPRNPALAHRLDRDTSGCLVLGRHRKALARLSELFRSGAVAKTYWAVVEGGPANPHGLIDLPLGRLDAGRGWRMRPDPEGLAAQTRWRLRGRGADAAGRPLAWLELEPLTGRTHQLRVHCAASGFPIAGDAVYGASPGANPSPLQLHARAISIPLRPGKAPVAATAPVPEHMRALLEACGWGGEEAQCANEPQEERP